MNLDNNFENRMKAILGDEYEELQETLSREKVSALRINTLKKCSKGEGQETLNLDKSSKESGIDLPFELSDKEIPWEKCGKVYTGGTPGKHPYHEAGVYYIQEPSAMAPVYFLDPRPGEKILDLCAAPGGKTTQIASKMQGEGILVTNEIDKKRAQILSLNVERCGVKNALVTNMEPGQLSDVFEGYFDKILVDAPCSGEGMFRKNDEAIENWSIDNVKLCADRQKTILDEAIKMLAPGGRLVYSTCTFAPEEDEEASLYIYGKGLKPVEATMFPGMVRGNIEYLKAVRDNLNGLGKTTEDNSLDASIQTENFEMIKSSTIRLFPHKIEGEGHFLCVFQKDGDISLNEGLHGINGKLKAASNSEMKIFDEFAKETFTDETFDLLHVGTPFMFGEQLYLAPIGMPGIKGLKVMRPGLHLGTIKKDRFEPSHALALFLSADMVKRSYDLPSEKPSAMQFIGGQTIREAGKENGWYLMTTDGYSLGWAKYAGGTFKNHYPKGLRIFT
ncbi:MAG: RNA methyltransferase [Butyrivibrio sp.]|nr:RNA methyltransferase [Butyrivibrio sp.]